MRTGDLPEHVRNLVAEIETEIGDSDELFEPAGSGAVDGDGAGPTGASLDSAAAIEGGAGRSNGNDRVEAAVRQILAEIGEDPDRQGLLGTPGRVHRMYAELTAGYHVDPRRLMNGAIFDVAYSEMVVVRDIPFYSLCEHHLLPFFGTAAVAYIPSGRVIGLSKIPRIVEMYARRLQVQERLTSQIADFLMANLRPQGVGVVIEATHLCAVMRGVRKPGTVMTTSHVLGIFRSNDKTRSEFLAHLARPVHGA
jgi:GTP cyclohydrolase I